MAIDIKRNDVQAQLWTIPGPLFTCCIFLAIVLKGALTSWILPIIAIGGIAVCNLWKWRGVAVSSAILALGMVYSLQSLPSQSWLWTIALSLSIVSTFVLTVLCSEEAYRALNVLNKDSTDHKQTLSLFNERLQLVQGKLAAEQKEKAELHEQLAAKEEKLRFNEQLLKLARKEISSMLEKQVPEKAMFVLQEELEKTSLHAHEKAKQIEELQEMLKAAEKEKQELLEIVSVPKEVSTTLEKQEQEKAMLVLQEDLEKTALHAHEKSIQVELLQEMLGAAEKERQELLEMVTALKSEKNEEIPENKNVEDLYYQLRQQFAEKTKTLSTTRRELFLAQEKLSVFQIDWTEIKIANGQEILESLRHLSNEAERELERMEQAHAIEVGHLHEVIESLSCKG